MSKRTFKIREHLLQAPVQKLPPDNFTPPMGYPVEHPEPNYTEIRYQLTLKAMDLRFMNTIDLQRYVLNLEDFIFAASNNPYPPSK